jgi:ubiquinone/menaquinone biosynthesis C-methylase UbiE
MGSRQSGPQGRPTLHDWITRIGLHVAKSGRRRYGKDHRIFYESFFSRKHLHQAMYDLRHRLRREAVLLALAEVFEQPGSPIVLDVGCGVGDVIRAVPSQCRRIGVTYSQADLRLARMAGESGVRFLRAAAEVLPFPAGSIDVTICLEVLEHLPDDRAAIREIGRVLKPGGQLIISVPGHYYFPDYLGLIGHYRHYSSEQLVHLLEEAGLRVVRYLDQESRINALHYYPYMVLEGLHEILNKCGVRGESLYVRPLIGSVYARIRDGLVRLKRDGPCGAFANNQRSTFARAEKVA